MERFKILFLGDIVGRVGRVVLKQHLSEIVAELKPDFIIANGENAAGGVGIDMACADEIYSSGVQFMTMGNHIWNKKEIFPFLEKHPERMIRPCNYPAGAPGMGYTIWTSPSGVKVGVFNLIARVFMPDLVDCPFACADKVLANELKDCKIRFLDFHGEATSEKYAMGWHLNGRVTMIVGTHTHVQTADDRILPEGTGYISDVGMCGAIESIIGVEVEPVLQKFVTGRPTRFDAAKGRGQLNGVMVTADPATGKALEVVRINRYYQ